MNTMVRRHDNDEGANMPALYVTAFCTWPGAKVAVAKAVRRRDGWFDMIPSGHWPFLFWPQPEPPRHA